MAATADTTAATPRSYWADIAIRGYESLPKAEEIGHHAYPRIIPALLNLAALDDRANGMPWEIDVLTHNAGGKMLDRHTPEAGGWGDKESTWREGPSPRDDQLHLPDFAAAMDALSEEGRYAVSCRQTEIGELTMIKIADMQVAIAPGNDAQPTTVFIPREQVGKFRLALEGTQLMKRFQEAPNASRSTLIPNRITHDWLGVTENVTEISSVTRLTLPDEDQPFFLDVIKRLENFQGDQGCLEPADLRRFNALRHQYLMPEAMLGPVPTEDVNDQSYELSCLICMAGTMHRNLDRESQVLGQPTTLESLERKVRLHMGKALDEDKRRHDRWKEVCGPEAGELLLARVQANQELRQGLGDILQDEPIHLPPKVTPIDKIRLSQPRTPEKTEQGFGEYPPRSDFHYRSQMSPL